MDPTRRSTVISLPAVEPAAVGVVPARPGTGSPVVLVLAILIMEGLMLGQLFRGERGRLSESWMESGLP